MPVYTYECEGGHVTEREFSYKSFPRFIACRCGRDARKVLSRVQICPTNTDFADYSGRDAEIMHAGHMEHVEMIERELAKDNVAEYTPGKDHRYNVRPERVKQLKEQMKKCPQPAQSE